MRPERRERGFERGHLFERGLRLDGRVFRRAHDDDDVEAEERVLRPEHADRHIRRSGHVDVDEGSPDAESERRRARPDGRGERLDRRSLREGGRRRCGIGRDRGRGERGSRGERRRGGLCGSGDEGRGQRPLRQATERERGGEDRCEPGEEWQSLGGAPDHGLSRAARHSWTITVVPSPMSSPVLMACQPSGMAGSVQRKRRCPSMGDRLMHPWLRGVPKTSCQ